MLTHLILLLSRAFAADLPADADSPMHDLSDAEAETHVIALPNIGFDTDDGLGFGARVELTRVGAAWSPYQASYVFQGFATLRGYHHHRFRLDLPYVGERPHRVTVHLAWRQWNHDGYWGLGNVAPLDDEVVLAQEEGNSQDYYRYTLIQPYSHFTLRTPLWGPWLVFGALDLKYSVVRTFEPSLLAAEQPFGMDGGLAATVFAGLLYDTREPEVTPEGGVLLELSGQASVGQHDAAYVGVLGSARAYQSLADRLVLAGRLIAEQRIGRVPFYDLVQWGGLIPVGGFGGHETVRGLSYGRYHGKFKAVANVELRVDVASMTALKRSLEWQLVPFYDTGLVHQPGDPWVDPEFPLLHHGLGAGVRAIFDTTLVGRLDVGVSPDVVRQENHSYIRPSLGIYFVFDHTF